MEFLIRLHNFAYIQYSEAAYPEEAREVANTVLPYLKEHDISHKVVQDVYNLNNLEGTRQEGKFITLYPEIDDDRKDVIMENGVQQFKDDDPSWNAFSIKSDTKNAAQIIEDLEDELTGSIPGLQGRTIDGKTGKKNSMATRKSTSGTHTTLIRLQKL